MFTHQPALFTAMDQAHARVMSPPR